MGSGELLTFFQGDVLAYFLYDFDDLQVVFVGNTALAVVAEDDGISGDDFSLGRSFLAKDHFEEGRFSTAVGSYDPDALAFFEGVVERFDEELVREALA